MQAYNGPVSRGPRGILLAATSSALFVACLVKPAPPGGSGGRDGGPSGGDGSTQPGDGSSEGGDASTGPGTKCQTLTPIDMFNGSTGLPCTTGPMASGGQLKMSAGGVSEERCEWTPATIGKGVAVEIVALGAGGTAGYSATAAMRLKFGTSTSTVLQLALFAGATSYELSTSTSPLQMPPLGTPIFLLFHITSDSMLSAKYRTSSFDSDLANWTVVDQEAFGAGTTTQPPTVDLVLDSGGTGSGTGSAAFAAFEYCQ